MCLSLQFVCSAGLGNIVGLFREHRSWSVEFYCHMYPFPLTRNLPTELFAVINSTDQGIPTYCTVERGFTSSLKLCRSRLHDTFQFVNEIKGLIQLVELFLFLALMFVSFRRSVLLHTEGHGPSAPALIEVAKGDILCVFNT